MDQLLPQNDSNGDNFFKSCPLDIIFPLAKINILHFSFKKSANNWGFLFCQAIIQFLLIVFTIFLAIQWLKDRMTSNELLVKNKLKILSLKIIYILEENGKIDK